MKKQSRHKDQRPYAKLLLAAFLALIVAGLAGTHLNAVILPVLKSFHLNDPVTLSGHMLPLKEIALWLGHILPFLITLGLILFTLREKHGSNDKSSGWFVIGFFILILLGIGGFFYLQHEKEIPVLLPEKSQGGYKAEDRQKLEQLINQGAKND